MKLKEVKTLQADEIEVFYSSLGGWRMFDGKLLTPTMRRFLQSETSVLAAYIEKVSDINHLIEVGCGYGRYLSWAVETGLGYDGIELVAWLARMGQARVDDFENKNPNRSIAITHGSASSIDFLLKNQFSNLDLKPLVIFPFNCFGSLSDPQAALKAVAKNKNTIVVSTFKIDEFTTAARTQYYTNCGYHNVQTSRVPHGLTTTSDEGFKSHVYSAEALNLLFMPHEFTLTHVEEFGEIGLFYVYTREDKRQTSRMPSAYDLISSFHEPEAVTLSMLVEHPKDTHRAELTIQSFIDTSGHLCKVSDNILSIEIKGDRRPAETVVKLDFHRLDKSYVGQIIDSQVTTSGKVTLKIKLFDSTLIESFLLSFGRR